VEEQLGPGIPQQVFTAQVHVRCKIKLVDWLWIVWIGGDQADTVLPKPISKAQYSIKPDHYCQKPLIFPKDNLTTSCYLNDLFFYVFSKFNDWQNMKSMTM
jgi:hypothetical protein